MLNTVRQYFHSPALASDFSRLEVGSRIHFSNTGLAGFSDAVCTVEAVHTYLFDSGSFVSYRLITDEGIKAGLILAEEAGAPYLALSRSISKQEIALLFPGDALYRLLDKPTLHYLACREEAPGLSGWTAPHYRKALGQERGSILTGRTDGDSAGDATLRGLHYWLLTSETDEYAIEVETYDDNSRDVFATVYRPLSAIRRITEARGSQRRSAGETSLAAASNFEAALSAELSSQLAASAQEKTSLLACDTVMAARLLEEAKRNDMALSQLIRRVLALPMARREHVLVPLPLTDDEWQILATRYGVAASDTPAIMAHIVVELEAFAGMREEDGD